MPSNSEISFFVDTLLVETVLSEPKLYKNAGFVSDLLSKVKDYFGSKIDRNNPTASVINELAPGTLWVAFQAMGIGKWGLLIGLLMSVFHVDVSGLLSSIYNKMKSTISSGKKVSPEEIDQAVDSSVAEHSTPSTEAEAEEGQKKLQEMQQQQSQPAADGKIYSSLELLQDAKIIRLAMIEYEDQLLRLTKAAASSSFLSSFNSRKVKGTSLLGKIFGWVFKIALASAGLMVAGDVVNYVLGRPNSLDGSYQPGKEQTASPPAVSGPTSTQTIYKLKEDSALPSSISITNNPQNIENILIQFAKDVYSGLDGKEQAIRNSAAFQAIKEDVVWYNIHNQGSTLVLIPPTFTSKKQLVDYFIDDVAKSDK